MKSLILFGRRWYNQNGEAFHTVSITIDYINVHTTDLEPGVDYIETAAQWLEDNEKVIRRNPGNDGVATLSGHLIYIGDIDYYFESAEVARKKDL